MDKKVINSIIEDFDYYTLWKYREKDINIVDCLSYFIENSINLCKSNYWDKNIKYDLEIKIIYDSKRNSYLIVDNSGGFNRDNLIKIMSTKLNHSSEMYDYAQNIKRGIFWLGKDASIFVKQPNDNEICGSYQGKNKIENDLVNIKIFESLKNNLMLSSGIAINILECYTYNRTLNNKNWNDIKNALGNKFSYYFSDNKFGTCKLLIFSDLFTNNDLGRLVTSNKIENNYEGIFRFSLAKKKIENDELDLLINDNLQDVIDDKLLLDFKFKIFNNQKLIFDDEIFLNDYSIPIKVYILSKPNIHLAGVSISYKNIFVYYQNLLNKHNSGLYVPFNERMWSGSWRWIRVEINLNNFNELNKSIKINDDRNKLFFDLNSNINVDMFNKKIIELFKKWCKFSCFIKEFLS